MRASPTTAIVDVRDHGATGDGTADDTDALQAALDIANSCATVHFPPGVYRISRSLMIRNALVTGAG